jgi:hypothetical protein
MATDTVDLTTNDYGALALSFAFNAILYMAGGVLLWSLFWIIARATRRARHANQAMQLTASKPAVYASGVCRRERMLRGMHRGLAAADLVSR